MGASGCASGTISCAQWRSALRGMSSPVALASLPCPPSSRPLQGCLLPAGAACAPHSVVKEHARSEWLLLRAKLILEIESSLPDGFFKDTQRSCPRWLHCLKVRAVGWGIRAMEGGCDFAPNPVHRQSTAAPWSRF
mgnify:CR=1 FL=1